MHQIHFIDTYDLEQSTNYAEIIQVFNVKNQFIYIKKEKHYFKITNICRVHKMYVDKI